MELMQNKLGIYPTAAAENGNC